MQTCMRAHLAICSITALLKSLLVILLVQQISKLKKKLSSRHLEFKIKLLARKSEESYRTAGFRGRRTGSTGKQIWCIASTVNKAGRNGTTLFRKLQLLFFQRTDEGL